ncbi:hypothetical protein B0H19DRAFT_1082699 [Mycena capillaripes]|nr:hypothetical protein B0H19DRAFT_1082699 [Mycena capillaripes]
MRRTALVLFALTARVFSQGLPFCAATCIVDATTAQGSPCTATDFACQCGNASLQSAISACLPTECAASDVAGSVSALNALCEAVSGSGSASGSSPSGGSPSSSSHSSTAVSATNGATSAPPPPAASDKRSSSSRSATTPPPSSNTGVGSDGSNTNTAPPKKQLHIGAIVGGVVGGIVVLLCVAAALLFWKRRAARTQRAPDINEKPMGTTEGGTAAPPEPDAGADMAAELRALKEQVQRLEQERNTVVDPGTGADGFRAMKSEQTRVLVEEQRKAEAAPPSYLASWGNSRSASGASGHAPAGSATEGDFDPYAPG